MSINRKLAVLYTSWKKPDEQFIAGGMVNEDEYETSDCKLLVLLKEANYKDSTEDWSLVDLINDQIKAYRDNGKNYLEIWKRIGLFISSRLCANSKGFVHINIYRNELVPTQEDRAQGCPPARIR